MKGLSSEKGENRLTKRQTARTNMELPELSTIEGASIGRRGKLLNEIRGENATRVAKKAQGRSSWRRGREVNLK